jgi:hypothetical protein
MPKTYYYNDPLKEKPHETKTGAVAEMAPVLVYFVYNIYSTLYFHMVLSGKGFWYIIALVISIKTKRTERIPYHGLRQRIPESAL